MWERRKTFDFNSIKVQLKPRMLTTTGYQMCDFNSIKVQLKRPFAPPHLFIKMISIP